MVVGGGEASADFQGGSEEGVEVALMEGRVEGKEVVVVLQVVWAGST